MLDMSQIIISTILPKINSQLIYIYDFLKMWRFLISYSKEIKKGSYNTEVTNSIGKMPKEAPEIIFEAREGFDSNNFTDIELDEFNDSEY